VEHDRASFTQCQESEETNNFWSVVACSFSVLLRPNAVSELETQQSGEFVSQQNIGQPDAIAVAYPTEVKLTHSALNTSIANELNVERKMTENVESNICPKPNPNPW
jgi:hypothetical protein